MFKSQNKMEFSFLLVICLLMMIAAIPGSVWAMTAPAVGDMGYDLYDIAVTKGIQGSFGFVGGIFTIILGAVLLARQQFVAAAPCILGGAALAKAQTLVTSLGMLC